MAADNLQTLQWPIKYEGNVVRRPVAKNPLDEYTAEAMMYFQKFKVVPGKLTGWKRLVGQEVPTEAYSNLMSIAGTSNYSATVVNLLDVNGDAVVGSPVSAASTCRVVTGVVNGPQTPKATQPALDLWVPLIFWFNRDPRLSIASVSIPLTLEEDSICKSIC